MYVRKSFSLERKSHRKRMTVHIFAIALFFCYNYGYDLILVLNLPVDFQGYIDNHIC